MVVAAHCVTELGKVTVIKTADLKVVLGKFYRDDDRDEKTIQNLRVRKGFLGNWSFDLTSYESRRTGPSMSVCTPLPGMQQGRGSEFHTNQLK